MEGRGVRGGGGVGVGWGGWGVFRVWFISVRYSGTVTVRYGTAVSIVQMPMFKEYRAM